MKYTGELYGKVAVGYVPLNHTSKQFDRMHEALKGLWKIRELLCYPLDVPFEHIDEAKAVSEALSVIESILNDLKS